MESNPRQSPHSPNSPNSPLSFRRSALALALGLAAGLLLVLGGEAAHAHGVHQAGFSGHEFYPGQRDGAVTRGVLFSGTDNLPCNCWTTNTAGGRWVIVADRSGSAGIGGAVTVVGGDWFWKQAGDVVHFGKLLGGSVDWPAERSGDLGCGPGVARFAVTLSVNGQASTGSATGCLDDTHIPFVFPPKIWATLSF